MNYNRKIMRLELSAEKALNGGYYYAELLLPATDYMPCAFIFII